MTVYPPGSSSQLERFDAWTRTRYLKWTLIKVKKQNSILVSTRLVLLSVYGRSSSHSMDTLRPLSLITVVKPRSPRRSTFPNTPSIHYISLILSCSVLLSLSCPTLQSASVASDDLFLAGSRRTLFVVGCRIGPVFPVLYCTLSGTPLPFFFL